MAGNDLVEGLLRRNSMVPRRRTQNLNSARAQNIMSILFHDNFSKIRVDMEKLRVKNEPHCLREMSMKSGVTYGFHK
jgi:hypothetical protein